jgi:hypothetical protein
MISLTDQITEAQRELALRKRTYPGFITRGHLTEGQAAYHLAVMAEIVKTLQRIEIESRQLPLFGALGTP